MFPLRTAHRQVFIPWAIGFVGAAGGAKTLNLRIGFDLNQGKNGAPSLRIRDFQALLPLMGKPTGKDTHTTTRSSELNQRAAEGETDPPPAIRADSFSDSNEKPEKADDSISKADSQSSDEEDASAPKQHVYNVRSTKGLRPGEYDPEDNGGVHGRYQEDEDESDDARRKRYKRKAENYEPSKRKGKKFITFRKPPQANMELEA